SALRTWAAALRAATSVRLWATIFWRIEGISFDTGQPPQLLQPLRRPAGVDRFRCQADPFAERGRRAGSNERGRGVEQHDVPAPPPAAPSAPAGRRRSPAPQPLPGW